MGNLISKYISYHSHIVHASQVIDIDIIFKKTKEGIAIMEQLKEGSCPKESMFKKINDILCDCLKSIYGW